MTGFFPMVVRRVVVVAAAALLAVGVVVPSGVAPAAAQDRASEKEQLEKRRLALDNEITALSSTIAELDGQITTRTAEVRRASAVLEVTADEFARTVEARKRPAQTRLLVAIDAYERGDRRVTNFVADLLLQSTDADRISELATQREIYAAVVEDADAKLKAVDDKLRELNSRSTSQQSSLKGLQDQLNSSVQKKKDSEKRLQDAGAERADVQRRIEALLASASTGLLTGLPAFEDRNRPALVVKIDNVEDARPPVGVNKADVVYEELVEGGLTRLAAVFHSRGAEPVGPVRSARSTDVELFTMLNRPLFANSGGNAGVRSELARSTLVDVGNSVVPSAYWRDENRVLPHNLFTTTGDLWAAKGGEGGTPPPLFSFRAPGAPAGGVAAQGVAIRFPTLVEYQWNGTGWARSQRGSPHVDADDERIAPANVIVQFVQYKQSNADSNSPQAIVTGSGDAWIFTAGRVIRGTWSRPELESVTVYTDDRGEIIRLTPGSTWVELPRPGSSESY